jgi:brefeldin A-inhibited guanine nucleotide-exchange protein
VLQLLALELLKVLLENSGPIFRSSERFTAAIRQYLCLSLLKNSASSIPAALQLSASIFLSLLQKFRAALKAEVGVFFPMVMLKVGCWASGGLRGALGGSGSAGRARTGWCCG